MAPTSDSIRLRVLLRMHAVDRSHDVPELYQQEFIEGIRASIKLPAPLPMDSYEVGREKPARTAHLALRGSYRAILTRDNHLRDIRVTGGTRNELMDRAIIDAMLALDSTGSLKELPPTGLSETEMPIFLYLTTGDAEESSSAQRLNEMVVVTFPSVPGKPAPAAARSDSGLAMPLFGFRSPVRSITRSLTQIPGQGALRYPANLRREAIDGQVDATFVVGPEGIAEGVSLAALRTDRLEFLQSIMSTMPAFRFRPLFLEGCAVRATVEQLFTFQLSR